MKSSEDRKKLRVNACRFILNSARRLQTKQIFDRKTSRDILLTPPLVFNFGNNRKLSDLFGHENQQYLAHVCCWQWPTMLQQKFVLSLNRRLSIQLINSLKLINGRFFSFISAK